MMTDVAPFTPLSFVAPLQVAVQEAVGKKTKVTWPTEAIVLETVDGITAGELATQLAPPPALATGRVKRQPAKQSQAERGH
jgi:hypothetical protein